MDIGQIFVRRTLHVRDMAEQSRTFLVDQMVKGLVAKHLPPRQFLTDPTNRLILIKSIEYSDSAAALQ